MEGVDGGWVITTTNGCCFKVDRRNQSFYLNFYVQGDKHPFSSFQNLS